MPFYEYNKRIRTSRRDDGWIAKRNFGLSHDSPTPVLGKTHELLNKHGKVVFQGTQKECYQKLMARMRSEKQPFFLRTIR